jgi:hypothetical protein
MDAAYRFAEIELQITERMRTDTDFRHRVITEIRSYARERYPTPDATRRPPSEHQIDDFVYMTRLLDLSSRASLDVFVGLSTSILADPDVSGPCKGWLFKRVLSQRFVIRVLDPEGLDAYDKKVVDLGMKYLDKSDGLRLRFGERSLFLEFTRHLIGYEQPGISLPPMDHEEGLEIARRYMADDRFHFFEREWYMAQVARFDPAIRAEYVQRLKKYVNDANTPGRMRLKYGEKLTSLGALTKQQLEELRQAIEKKSEQQ